MSCSSLSFLVLLVVVHWHSPEHQSLWRSRVTFEGRRAGVGQCCLHICSGRPSVPHSEECGHDPANHLTQEGVPDHLDGDPLTLLLLLCADPHPMKGPNRLSILPAKGGVVVSPFEHPGCLGHCLEIQRVADTDGASLAKRTVKSVPDEVAVFAPLRPISRPEAPIDLAQRPQADICWEDCSERS